MTLQYNPLSVYNISRDLTERIKLQIKEKLIELNVYVDDELPEYVLILLGNKKSEEQMSGDLDLFLGANSLKFATWISAILNECRKTQSQTDNTDELAIQIDTDEFNDEQHHEAVTKKPSSVHQRLTSVISRVDEDNGHDRHRPTVSSVVKVSERKYSVPKSLQPNKSILLKAINDANNSVAQSSSPTTIANGSKKSPSVHSRLNFAINKENKFDERRIQFPNEVVADDEDEPKFIVTLNGVDNNSLKRRLSENDENENETMDVELENTTPSKKNKIRCLYWPKCEKTDTCPYVHPNKPCKVFPNCTFGAKCLYIHPKCRYDGFCTRGDCTYAHMFNKQQQAIPSLLPIPQLPIAVSPMTVQMQQIFKSKKQTECKFSNACKNAVCKYKHSNLPPKSALKWTAAATTVSPVPTTE